MGMALAGWGLGSSSTLVTCSLCGGSGSFRKRLKNLEATGFVLRDSRVGF